MGPLEGIRVLDLSRAMAGPYCTMMLGDLGADVIKVERPGSGDESRGWGPPFVGQSEDNLSGESAYFLSVNRNKRSITVNLKSSEGQEVIQRLASLCDVLVENFRTGVLETLGMGYEDIKKLNPSLVYCSISGYGRTGPYAERPGYDVMIQAEGGMMGITGPVEGPPSRVGVPIVDITTGMFAATSILAALRARDQTKEGQLIDISLFDTQAALLTNVASNYLIGGTDPRRMGNAHPNLAPYEAFRAQDRWLVLGVANELQWKTFCVVIDRQDLREDVRFRTNGDRVAHRAELGEILSEVIASRQASEWLSAFRNSGLPCGPINDVAAVFDHPQIQPRDLILEVEHPTAGPIHLTGFPYKLTQTPAELRYPPPLLGEHTEDVLTEMLGYSIEEVAQFRERGAI
ncbi:MAG: CoA transferase [Anaerolineales bacterium]|nr:CoA transferase [Anaerolineales bacterium]